MQPTEERIERVRQLSDQIVNQKDLTILDRPLVADHFTIEGRSPRQGQGALKQYVESFHKNWSNPDIEISEVISHGDQLVIAWRLRGTFTAPRADITGKHMDITGITRIRTSDGQLQELSNYADVSAVLNQLGIVDDAP